MKTRLYTILIFAFIVSNICYAQSSLDTVYYNRDWHETDRPPFASFYRVYEDNTDSDSIKIFRDYYITGEIFRDGYFIALDKSNDNNTIFHGKCISYYKSGATMEEEYYDNGRRNGQWVRYKEDGSPIFRASMKDNEFNGLRIQYNDDGICLQQEYAEGKPLNDYYIMTDNEGRFSKIYSDDDSPLYTTPSLNEKKVKYVDGTEWPFYVHDGLIVALLNTRINDYGKYYRVYIVIQNNSFFPIEFDPSETYAMLTKKTGEVSYLEIQTAEEYDKRVKRTQSWEEGLTAALTGISNGLANTGSAVTTSTTVTNYSGFNYPYANRYSPTTHSGTAITTTTTYNTYSSGNIDISQMVLENVNTRKNKLETYLKKTTISPGETLSGYFNVKRKDGITLDITLNIAGAQFLFPWDVSDGSSTNITQREW